jgi:hypothetical protein
MSKAEYSAQYGVVEQPAVADDLRNVRIGREVVGADGGFVCDELLAQRVGHDHVMLPSTALLAALLPRW